MVQQSKGSGGAVPSTHPKSPTGQPRSPARRAPHGNTGIAQAKSLVQAILNQITMGDSPPINQFIITRNASNGTDGANGKGVSPKRAKENQLNKGGRLSSTNSFSNSTMTSKSSNNYSRQQHIHVLPMTQSPAPCQHNGPTIAAPSPTAAVLGDAVPFLPSPSFANSHISQDSAQLSNFTFERTSLPTSVSIETPRNEILPKPPPLAVNRLGKGAEILMGNLTLAALCVRTIESVADDMADMAHIQRQESGPLMNIESKESMGSWRRDIEMAPTFASDEKKKEYFRAKANNIENEDRHGSMKREEFLLALDKEDANHGNGGQPSDEYPLFPDAKMSEDDSQGFNDTMNPIVEEEEDDLDDIPDIIATHSKEDGVLLSAVAEENEDDDGHLNTSFEATHLNEPYNAASPRHDHHRRIHMSPSGDLLSPDSAGNNTKLTLSPERPPLRPRMQMFGSEYARHLSSESPFSPAVHKSKSRSFSKRKALKNKRNSSAAMASLTSPLSPNSANMSTGSILSAINSHSDSQTYSSGPQGGHGKASNRSLSTISNLSLNSSGTSRVNLEEASAEILGAAITDIVVTHGREKPPKGYYAISQTSSGIEIDLLKSMTKGGIGKRKISGVFLNVKKEPKWERAVQRPCVTALAVIFPERNEFVPPGFCVVRRYKATAGEDKKGSNLDDSKDDKTIKDEDIGASSSSYPANLNYGTSGERVYLCYRRSREGNPITGMIPLQPSNNEAVPEGYTVLERSPRNFIADINSKAGPSIFLAFRQRLANLETLRPLPLLLSVLHSNKPSTSRTTGKKRARLKAYYCTGGTLVPSDVGEYHIMDRSTHPLISPSSVTNRLSLIQAARSKNSSNSVSAKKSGQSHNIPDRSPSPVILANGLIADTVPQPTLESPSSGLSLQYSNSLRSEDKSDGGGDAETDSMVSEATSQPQKETLVDNILHLVNQISPKYGKKVDEEEKAKSLLVGDMVSDSQEAGPNKSENNADGMSVASSVRSNIFGFRNEADLDACFEAMDFIPRVESPVHTLGEGEKITMETLLEARTAVLTPILTACYTHHGGSSLLAVEGLTKLLSETDFFLPDVAQYEDSNTNQRLTLLDLSIQVVCDMANSSARETNFLPCIEFVVEATHYSRGNLNARTIGYIMRFYLFVFYFGASVPTVSSWPKNKTSGFSRKEGLDEANDTLLLSEDELDDNGEGRRRGYVPGGAPQAAALAIKELITLFLARLRKMKFGGRRRMNDSNGSSLDVDEFMKDYVNSLVDGAMHQVDVSNYAQLALHQIQRSGGSELFWHDMMTSCGSGLFGSDTGTVPAAKNFYITSFAILSSIVKVTSGKVRRLTQSSEFVPRDISSKLLSLELMHHFLHQWGKTCKYTYALQNKASKESWKMKASVSVATMAYTIRRLIIPCLLSNTRAGLDDIKVFRRMMRIVTELWCNPLLRRHIKIEIGVLIEHFVLKILRLGPQVLPPKRLSKSSSATLNEMCVSLLPQQVCIVTEMKTWFLSEPRDILELFMNFDQVDAQASKTQFSLLPSTHWKITQQMCGALSTLAEQCTDIVSDQIRMTRIDLSGVDSQSTGANQSLHHTENDLREMTLVREGARYLQEKCFDTIAQIVRSLMLCAAASSGANYNLLSKLREKQEHDIARRQAEVNTITGKETNIERDDDSSKDSDGNMTVKSVSTIGNIVGGIMKKKREHLLSPESIKVPESPRQLRQVPQLTLGDDDGNGIVEYWQTSIASERRKNFQPSPKDSQDPSNTQKKPPRKGRSSHKSVPASPARLSSTSRNFRGASPITGRSPRRDDISVVSFADESVRGDPHLSQKFEDTLNTAFEIMQAKSLKKALEYLNACKILTSSPRDIATFLRLYQTRIDTSVLGDYLGEGGKDGDEVEHYNLIRFHYTSAISFVGMNVEQGLRHFLTNCGFRLPGEAQKIDRVMTTFSQCYWEDNAGDHGRCPFQDQDTVFLISFAIIMLNTDLHKVSMFEAPKGRPVPKHKQRKKMTKPEFLNNLRGVDNSEDLSREYLSQIYDSIADNPIAIYRPPDNSSLLDSALGKKTITFSSGEFGHIIQGNIDLAGMIKHIIKSAKPCQELLRGLSSHEHPYLTIKNSRKNRKKSRKHLVPEELVRSAFCSLWHHFHGTINSALDAAHLDPKGLENCLDVLMYALCTTICLDLTVERNAFTSQLVRVKCFRENRGLEEDDDSIQRPMSRIRDHLDYKNDPWYTRIEKAAESYHENAKIAALDEVDSMFKKLHASLKVDSTLKNEMIKVARRIRNGQILLNDPTRYFLKEGLLKKKCNRTGRNIVYTFFLFSDMLIYAHKSGELYKIHGELPLHQMKIMDVNGARQKKSFNLIHPRKSFLISASNTIDKATWLATIDAAMGREVKRKARIEGARQSSAAFDR